MPIFMRRPELLHLEREGVASDAQTLHSVDTEAVIGAHCAADQNHFDTAHRLDPVCAAPWRVCHPGFFDFVTRL